MTALLARLQLDLNTARKAQDKGRVTLLGTIISEVKNREIELKRDLTDDDVIDVLRRGIKKRRESVEAFEKGGRTERANTEKAEIKTIEGFLPPAVPPDEIRAVVRAAIQGGATDIGKVMGVVMPQFKGRADGKLINQIVREELSTKS